MFGKMYYQKRQFKKKADRKTSKFRENIKIGIKLSKITIVQTTACS